MTTIEQLNHLSLARFNPNGRKIRPPIKKRESFFCNRKHDFSGEHPDKTAAGIFTYIKKNLIVTKPASGVFYI